MADYAEMSLSPYATHNLLTLLDMQEGRLIALFSCATRTGAVHLDDDELARAITQVDQISGITHRLTSTRKTLAQMEQMQLHAHIQVENYEEKQAAKNANENHSKNGNTLPPAIASNLNECGNPTPSGESSISSDQSLNPPLTQSLNSVRAGSVPACPTIPLDKIKAYAAETEAMIQAWEKEHNTPEAEREPQPASPGNVSLPPAISSISPNQSLNPPIIQSLNSSPSAVASNLIFPGTPADYATFPGPCDNCGRPFCDNRRCWTPPSQFTLDDLNGLYDEEEEEPIIQWVPGSPPPLRTPRAADG